MTGVDKELDYEEDVKIDPNSLEKCLIDQADLYGKWTTAWAIAVKERDRAKEELEVVRSELSRKARSDWEIFGFPKSPTDSMVNNWVPAQKDYREINFYLIEATFKANVLAGAKQAFEHRVRALSDLVKLYLSGYYADERIVGKEARELLDDIRTEDHLKQLNETDQRKKLRRRK